MIILITLGMTLIFYTFMYLYLSNSSVHIAMIHSKPFSIVNFNPHILNVEYAVRGLIPTRASEIARELEVDNKWPFDEITYLNLGNPQNLGLKPITFARQLISLCAYPPIIDLPGACTLFPEDVLYRAKSILSSISSFGGYSDSFGFEFVRREVANFIYCRDNYQADFRDIFLSDGASRIIFNIISCIAKIQNDIPSGILIPIPQYPLYTACLSYFGIVPIPYYLDEDNDWGLSIDELQQALALNHGKSIPRAMVVINPGNPTGQCLPFHLQVEILKFCNEQSLLLLADEVYQDNLHDDSVEWFSFRRVYFSIQQQIPGQQLISFHSISKGYMGECGFRGGYAEIIGMDEETRVVLTKILSSMLCPNIAGQLILSTYVNPPKEGDASYISFINEKKLVSSALRRKSLIVHELLNSLNGITMNRLTGSMYAFPKVFLPKGFIDYINNDEKILIRNPDEYYCLLLLENTGIVSIPGSGFGQKNGTWHFRITILPNEKKLLKCLEMFKEFHLKLMKDFT